MALWRRRSQHNAITAAVVPLADERDAHPAQYEPWQDEAWDFYHILGEYRQGVTWLANVISRIRLVPAYAPQRPGDEPEPIDPETEDPAVDLVGDIAHGIGGQAELLRSAAVHLTVPGEGWFVGQTPGIDMPPDTAWKFYSADELRHITRRGNVTVTQVRVGPNKWVDLPPESLVIRVWRPDDRYHWMADSSTRAALPIMRRLELLNRRVDAHSQSRLWSNGVYWIASEISFPPNPNHPEGTDPFVAQFMDVGVTAIKTPGSAAAAFPLVNRAPFQMIKDGVRYDKFSGDTDESLRADREFEIRRLATAIDVPPEVLLGMAGVNHWGAWQIEESALKTTVTNLIELICWSLTVGYLQPALNALRDRGDVDEHPVNAAGEEVPLDIERIVWYDLSELTVRPDRSQDARALHERLVITDEALMRETGMDEGDLLTDPEEIKRRVAILLLSSPYTVPYGLQLLGLPTEGIEVPQRSIPSIGVPGGNGDAPPNGDSGGPPATRDEVPSQPPGANGSPTASAARVVVNPHIRGS